MKKLTLREKIEAKKKVAAQTVEAPKTEEKKKRGRPAKNAEAPKKGSILGKKKTEETKPVEKTKRKKMIVSDDNKTILENSFSEIQGKFESLTTDLGEFLEKNNKSSAKRARVALGEIAKLAKDMRKKVQEAKVSLVEAA